MSKRTPCRTKLLAESTFSSITVCTDCDLYHLNIGPMSFRMEGAIFDSVCQMILNFYMHKEIDTQECLAQKH